jgi:hypothetical protein
MVEPALSRIRGVISADLVLVLDDEGRVPPVADTAVPTRTVQLRHRPATFISGSPPPIQRNSMFTVMANAADRTPGVS